MANITLTGETLTDGQGGGQGGITLHSAKGRGLGGVDSLSGHHVSLTHTTVYVPRGVPQTMP